MTTARRPDLVAIAATGLAAAFTTWAALLSWSGFVETSSPYLVPAAILGIVIALSGLSARAAGAHAGVAFVVQAAAASAVTSWLITGSPVPLGGNVSVFRAELDAAVSAAQEFAAPVPASAGDGIYALLILGAALCLLLADLLAVTLSRVTLTAVVPIAVFSVAVTLLGGEVRWWVFAMAAAGYLTMLFTQTGSDLDRWGQAVAPRGEGTDSKTDSGQPAGFGVRTRRIRTSAGVLGATATAVALVAPLVIPTLALGVFDVGAGQGTGDDVSVENPFVDLRRDLKRGDDVPLVDIRTDDPAPSYLRISVLNVYESESWRPGNREIPSSNRPGGTLPKLPGVAEGLKRQSYSYEVAVTDNFESTWLPTQAPISAIEAEGDWRYDPQTRDFIASEDGLTTAGSRYSMDAVDLDLRPENLADAPKDPENLDPLYSEVPGDLPPVVSQLAEDVTSDAENAFEQAVDLQQWFRQNFTYDLENSPEDSSADTLERFLDESGRVGYCEQFSAAMAVMARTLGIPARVAVGFLKPDEIGVNTWQYSAYDLHAWPELYFEGFGWVRFEPTPSDRVSGVPGYTRERAGAGQTPPQNRPPEQPQPSRGPDRPDEVVPPQPEPEPEVVPEPIAETATPWRSLAVTLGLLLLVIAAILTPRVVRSTQRSRRLSRGCEGAWAELAATGIDLGLPWPQQRSPRETHDTIIQWFGAPADEFEPELPARGAHLDPDAVLAMERITASLEAHRYAPTDEGVITRLSAEVGTVSDALGRGCPPKARRRARWLPVSVWRKLDPTPSIRDDAPLSGTGSAPTEADRLEPASR